MSFGGMIYVPGFSESAQGGAPDLFSWWIDKPLIGLAFVSHGAGSYEQASPWAYGYNLPFSTTVFAALANLPAGTNGLAEPSEDLRQPVTLQHVAAYMLAANEAISPARRMGRAERTHRGFCPAAKHDGFRKGSTHPTDFPSRESLPAGEGPMPVI